MISPFSFAWPFQVGLPTSARCINTILNRSFYLIGEFHCNILYLIFVISYLFRSSHNGVGLTTGTLINND